LILFLVEHRTLQSYLTKEGKKKKGKKEEKKRGKEGLEALRTASSSSFFKLRLKGKKKKKESRPVVSRVEEPAPTPSSGERKRGGKEGNPQLGLFSTRILTIYGEEGGGGGKEGEKMGQGPRLESAPCYS